MSICLRRREFIAGLGGTVTAWPLVTQAQQRALPVVGYVSVVSAEAPQSVRSRSAKVWAKPATARGGT